MAFRSVASLGPPGTRPRSAPHPAWLDLGMALLSLWWVVGLFLDGWAHTHLDSALETFFTPWHAVLYSGFFATGALLAFAAFRGWRATGDWRDALPAPYRLSALGVAVFAAGGASDLVWHTLFGIEANVEALVSPTHLLLMVGFVLVIGGPLRAAVAGRPLGGQLPGVLSASLLLSVLGFFTQVLNPFVRPWAGLSNRPVDEIFRLSHARPPVPDATGGILAADVAHMTGIGGFLVQTALVVGILLHLYRRGLLPAGAATVVLGVYGILLGLMRDQTWAIPAALLAGLAVDLAVLALGPTRRAAPLLIGAGTPVVLWALYLGALHIADGIGWSIHLTAGVVVASSLVGLLLASATGAPRERSDARSID